jgi:translation initiation factor 3 subunit F
MLALYKQVSPKDVVVGWYSTSGSNESVSAQSSGGTPEQLNYITSLMHEVYRGQMPSNSTIEPLHLNVDVSMKGGMKISGFVNQVTRSRLAAGAPSQDLLANFQPVPIEMHAYEEEKIGVDALISGVPDDDARLDAPATFLTECENIEASVVKILESIESLEAYIEKVAAGKVQNPNTQLALQIHNLLSSLPTLDAATFSNTFATHIQDLLSIVYLANMTKNQLAIADKANMLL